MNKTIKQFVVTCVLLSTLPAFALSLDDCKELPDCESQACEVQYKLNIVKRQYKQKEMPRKTTVTYKITSYVPSGKITSDLTSGKYRVMVFNDFFNNISVISWLRTWVNIKLPHVSSGKYKITSCLIR